MSGDSVPWALPLARFRDWRLRGYDSVSRAAGTFASVPGVSGALPDEAQDVVQDAFLSLHRHLASGGSQENIRGWVFRVAHNQARNRQGSYDRRFGEPLDAGD